MITEDKEVETKFQMKLAGIDPAQSGGTEAWQTSLRLNAEMNARRN